MMTVFPLTDIAGEEEEAGEGRKKRKLLQTCTGGSGPSVERNYTIYGLDISTPVTSTSLVYNSTQADRVYVEQCIFITHHRQQKSYSTVLPVLQPYKTGPNCEGVSALEKFKICSR